MRCQVERIIVQSGYSAEAVAALGESDKIIGVTQTIHERPEIYPMLKEYRLDHQAQFRNHDIDLL